MTEPASVYILGISAYYHDSAACLLRDGVIVAAAQEERFTRIRHDAVEEIIVATPPSVDGEATALLLKRELAHLNVSITRIASGVPHGGDLEYADEVTLGRAFEGRRLLDV